MKAEELMIGDWVSFPDLGKTLFVTIVGIEQREGLGRIEGYTFILRDEQKRTLYVRRQSVKPIPLTPEILEKNGFRLTKADTVSPADRYWWAIDGTRDGAMVEITLYNPDVHGVKALTKIHTQSSHESGVNTVHSCDIESVHELQHALRLCCIDKEIVL